MAGSRGRGLEEKWDALELTEDSGENLPTCPATPRCSNDPHHPPEAPTSIVNWPVVCNPPDWDGMSLTAEMDRRGLRGLSPAHRLSSRPLPLFII